MINKIHNMDCLELLKNIDDNSIDLVLCDPPYMITSYDYDKKSKDSLCLDTWFKEIIRVAKDNAPILIFSSGKFTYKMVNLGFKYFRYELIWDKINRKTGFLDANSKPLLIHEFVLYFSKSFFRPSNKHNKNCNTYNHGVIQDKSITNSPTKSNLYNKKTNYHYKITNDKMFPSSILKFKKHEGKKHIHPSEKPYALIENLIQQYSNKGDVVLDTFSGSGVVAHACILNERKYILCELNVDYYNKSINRLDGLFNGDN